MQEVDQDSLMKDTITEPQIDVGIKTKMMKTLNLPDLKKP